MGPANGLRVSTYRVALIVAGGVFVGVAGLVGWQVAFLTAAVLLAILALVSSHMPHPAPGLKRPSVTQSWSTALTHGFLNPLKSLWRRPGVIAVLLFVLLFKLGDMALGPMVRPFWVDREFTPLQIGMIPGTVGVVSTIIGALLGGRLTRQWGLFRALWVLGIAQAGSNLFYAVTAMLPRSELAYVWRFDCRVVLRRAGDGTIPGFSDEYLRQTPGRDAIRPAERALWPGTVAVGGLLRGTHPECRLRHVFQPDVFSGLAGFCPSAVGAYVDRASREACLERVERIAQGEP